MKRIVILSPLILVCQLFGMESEINQPKELKEICLNIIVENKKVYAEGMNDGKLPLELKEKLKNWISTKDPNKGLLTAIRLNKPEMIAFLKTKGGEVNYTCVDQCETLERKSTTLQSLVYKAVLKKRFDCLKALLEQGAETNCYASVFIEKTLGKFTYHAMHETPLHLATRRYQNNFCELLLEYGANPTTRDSNGRTPANYFKYDADVDYFFT